jgi:Ca2+-binding RTX toxin-like protein
MPGPRPIPWTWTGTAGKDYYAYSFLDDFRGTGLEGNDTLIGNLGNDLLSGGEDNDSLDGGDGNDTLYGDTSDDFLNGAKGNDSLVGGIGNDFLNGGKGNDILVGDTGNDFLNGGDGNDELVGGTGNDTLVGGAGNDSYYIDSVSDTFIENFNAGIDTVYASYSYSLSDTLENLTLLAGYSGIGNSLDNLICGNDTDNYLSGGAGNDTLSSSGGNDTLLGEEGNDLLSDYQHGNSILLGGRGNDTLEAYLDNDTLKGGNGNDYLRGVGNYPNLSVHEGDTLIGGAGADRFALAVTGIGTFYLGEGYATITDFRRRQGDKIEVIGGDSSVISRYSLDKSLNFSGSSALDTGIYYLGDLIGVVQDTTHVSIAADFNFL